MVTELKKDWIRVHLGARKVVRLVVEGDSAAEMVLADGSAESEGVEIALGRVLKLPDGTTTLCTHEGVLLHVRGEVKHYVATYTEENNFVCQAVNIHACLEQRRRVEQDIGPRVLVCGNNGFGKTRLCRHLVNYRLRMHNKILYIDAELKYKDICIPGSISAMVATEAYDILNGWKLSDKTVTFNFGHSNGMTDPELYLLQLQTLSDLVERKFNNDSELSKSGFILNLDSLDDGDISFKRKEERAIIIRECIQKFEIDYVFVIEDGYLKQIIKEDLSPKVKIFQLSIPNQSLSDLEEQTYMFGKILYNYFTGQGYFKIQLRSFLLHSSKFQIFRFNVSNFEDENRLIEPVEMPFTVKFTNSILAVSQAKKIKDISIMPIYGYVMVIDVKTENLVILSPAAELLPSTILLFTSIKSPNFW